MYKKEVLEAKCKLYLLLMKINIETITDNELDIMLLLAKDKQIQEYLQKKKND